MFGRAALAIGAVLALTGACGSGHGAPRGAVTDCGRILSGGAFRLQAPPDRKAAATCFVAALRACHAARLELDYQGVDTGAAEVLTVRRASGGRCVTSAATSSSVLGRGDTHRHEVCVSASVVTDGVDLSGCKKSG